MLRTISLRKRLILTFILIVIVMTAIAMAVMVRQARSRVVAERVSASDLADHLIDEAIANLSPSTEDPLDRLDDMVRGLSGLRHVRVVILRPGTVPADREAVPDVEVPEWFSAMLRPVAWQKRHPIVLGGHVLGDVLILGNADDEIAELWQEMRVGGGLLVTLMTVFIAAAYWLVGKALHPLQLISDGLDRLGQGDFATSLPPFDVGEFKDVGRKFNSLSQSLKQMSGDNRFLIQKLISVQESERSTLAHELHDELGPCLFGIKAQAACIARPAQGTVEEGQARTIMTLVDDLQRLNRRILARLRPMVLQDLGAAAAIGQLIDDWRSRLPDIDWQFRCAEFTTPLDDALALTLYRVVQECLTNAARHSGATQVVVEIDNGPADYVKSGGLPSWPSDTVIVAVAVRDNGRGIDGNSRPGFGLLGIQERAKGRGGVVRVGTGIDGGAVIEALLPLTQRAGEAHG